MEEDKTADDERAELDRWHEIWAGATIMPRFKCDADGWCFLMGAFVAGGTRHGFHVATKVNRKTHEQRLELVYGLRERRARRCPYCKGDPNARYAPAKQADEVAP